MQRQGLPLFSLSRMGHLGEWRRTSLEIGHKHVLFAQGNNQSHGGAYHENTMLKGLRLQINVAVARPGGSERL